MHFIYRAGNRNNGSKAQQLYEERFSKRRRGDSLLIVSRILSPRITASCLAPTGNLRLISDHPFFDESYLLGCVMSPLKVSPIFYETP